MHALVIHAARDLRVEPVATPAVGPRQLRVQVRAGGICGSDLHYYHDGGFGAVRIREPMILGHEVAGVVTAVGTEVAGIAPGTRIAINPSRPCGRCRYCQEGRQNQCLAMRFYGSAMPMPHIQGAFRQELVIDDTQAHPVADSVGDAAAATAEPLAVALHAVRRAGPLLGKRVLITGCGPIGALTVLAARRAGALEIVVSDISPAPLAAAVRIGADRVINSAADPDALAAYGADKGYFDVLFEASGNERAARTAIDVLRPGAIAVQIGLGGDMTLPVGILTAKEIEWRGTFRFHTEFALAVALTNQGLIDVSPLISATFPFEQAVAAFELAADRSKAMKVQLSFA